MAPVVQKLDNAIHWIAQLVSVTLNRWIVIYPVDSAIQRLNNWSLAIYLINFLRIFSTLFNPSDGQMQKWTKSPKSQSRTIEFKKQWVPNWKYLGLYVTRKVKDILL